MSGGKTWRTISAALLAALLLIAAPAAPAAAFPDIASDPNGDKIMALQEAGILEGGSDGLFRPEDKLTYAAGITMIVRGLGLNLDEVPFIQKPRANDAFDFVLDGQWYSEAFITASVYLDVPRSVKPGLSMTRERYAHHLYRGIAAAGKFALPEPELFIEDEAGIAPEYRESVNMLLLTGIAALNGDKKFEPKRAITRSEAAGMLYEAVRFLRKLEETDREQLSAAPGPLTEISLASERLNESVKAVTIRATAPHPGYGIRVSSIVFEDNTAFIHVEPVMPDPERFYPQVLTEVNTVAYIGAEYEPVLALKPSS